MSQMRFLWVMLIAMLTGMAVAVSLSPAAAQGQEMTSSGRVASIDLFKRRVALEERAFGVFPTGKAKEFLVTAETGIVGRDGKQPIRLGELAPGDRVTIEYAVDRDRNLARSIRLQEPAVQQPVARSAPLDAERPLPPEAHPAPAPQ